ncbi:UDP-N-acetylmuramoyl-L-alanyl-D-glutamate--L-lysine ligase [Vagococcus sp.]|uniref:UDP-N-acetylmuramoyl-L-alanyl-D-glutamate--L- lysine ligase n=1 Tax=Vagococcus sp. TaxID=1933889 RepID=UPI003F9E208F
MTITLKKIEELLLEHHLLKEFITNKEWHYHLPITNQVITELTYDSRQVATDSLLFCKGIGFKQAFLEEAIKNGLSFYVSETPYDVDGKLGIIVTDIKKAMSIIAMAFYNYPQKELFLIGYTGTKGKTTCSYFTKSILDRATHKKTAMLSTMNTTLDGVTFFKSKLTTPESLDLFRMMRESVENGMTHFIMEVSSQAYKVQRVYNLLFDVGIFLNISPDHISPIEHPTFDDYFYCKRQLLLNSKQVVLFKETDYFDILEEILQTKKIPYLTYSSHSKEADYYWKEVIGRPQAFVVNPTREAGPKIAGEYDVSLRGDFNKDNALATLIVSSLAGATLEDCKQGLAIAEVPGRMDHLQTQSGVDIYVDYAHNLISLQSLLTFAKKEHPKAKIITVIGSPGNKALSRRKDFGTVLSDLTDVVVLTADDPDREDPQKIANEISASITNIKVEQSFEMDREVAIRQAIAKAEPGDVVVVAGKGRDAYQRINGESAPYQGDYEIVRRMIK